MENIEDQVAETAKEIAVMETFREDCGITPCEFKVLVIPDESDVIASFRRA
jgi:hypothetical protein